MTRVQEPDDKIDRDSDVTARSVAVGCITLTRYLRIRHPDLSAYLASSLHNALEAGLSKEDLKLLKMMVATCAP